jgi:hypothetical protein
MKLLVSDLPTLRHSELSLTQTRKATRDKPYAQAFRIVNINVYFFLCLMKLLVSDFPTPSEKKMYPL